jgi:hypothetical protein
MNQDNGGVIGKINTPTTTLASGVWSLDSQFDSQSSSIWPLAFPQVTFTNSCRFNDDDSNYLNKTFSGNGNRRTFTLSWWFKNMGGNVHMKSGSSGDFFTLDNNSQRLRLNGADSSVDKFQLICNRVFRDPSAWYNFVAAFDTTQSTASDRVKFYVNGSQITSFATENYPTQNYETQWGNSSLSHGIGARPDGNHYFDGYMTEIIYVDGQQLTPSSFGLTNPVTNIWEPRAYAGTYGTNGFKLNFSDSSNLGDDTSGNGNDFTAQNMSSTNQSTDTCSNNFATFNSVVNAAGNNLTLSEGNLKVTSGDNNWNSAIGTIAVNSGKWYWEVKIVNATNNYNHGVFSLITGDINDTTNPMNQTGYSGFYNFDGGETRIDDTVSTSDFGTFAADDILGFYLNADDNQFTIYKNGSSHVSATNLGTGRTDLVPIAVHYNGGVSDYNFGNSPFSISSGNADANGYGNFEYSPTIGGVNYYALCTKNLAEFGG